MHLRGNLRSRDLTNITQNRLKTRQILDGRGETAFLPKLMSPGVTGEKWMGKGVTRPQSTQFSCCVTVQFPVIYFVNTSNSISFIVTKSASVLYILIKAKNCQQ